GPLEGRGSVPRKLGEAEGPAARGHAVEVPVGVERQSVHPAAVWAGDAHLGEDRLFEGQLLARTLESHLHRPGTLVTGKVQDDLQFHLSRLRRVRGWAKTRAGGRPQGPAYLPSFLAPYFDRACLRSATPWASSTPRIMW